MPSWSPSNPKGSRAGAHSTSPRTTRSRRSRMARPLPRSFSSAMRVLECGPSSQHRMNRTTARRTPSTDGAGAWSLVSHGRSAAQRTFPSAARPGCRSSDGRSGRVRCTPRPSDRWCTRTSACGTRTEARSRSANGWPCHLETTVPAPARAARIARACRPARSARSPRTVTTWRRASRTSTARPARPAGAGGASPDMHARSGARRLTMRRRPHSTCGRSSTRGGANREAVECLAAFDDAIHQRQC